MTVEHHIGKGDAKTNTLQMYQATGCHPKKGRPYSFASLLFNRFAGVFEKSLKRSLFCLYYKISTANMQEKNEIYFNDFFMR